MASSRAHVTLIVAVAAVTAAAITACAKPPTGPLASTRNLFDGTLAPSAHHSASAIDQKLGISASGTVVMQDGHPVGAYQRYLCRAPFYGERTGPDGRPEAYIYALNGGNDVRTEGMGWAMMICVQANDQDRFDRFLRFVDNHMRQNPDGYYNWRTDRDGNLINGDRGCAPDGDEWITTALIMAQHRWGGSYIDEARRNLSNMVNNRQWMFHPDQRLVVFGPGYGMTYTDASYVQPAFYGVWWDATGHDNSGYENWVSWTGGDRSCWSSIAKASRSYLNASATAIRDGKRFHPDRTGFDGQPYHGSKYSYDAFRTPMNGAIDSQWNGLGDLYAGYCRDRQDYYYTQTPRRFSNGNNGELAMNACAGECYTGRDQERADFAEALWEATPPGDYYGGMLYTLGFLVTTGRFKYY